VFVRVSLILSAHFVSKSIRFDLFGSVLEMKSRLDACCLFELGCAILALVLNQNYITIKF
jgi:hypothetical protein